MARADPARRGRVAAAVSRRPPRGCDRGAARAGGPLRADRSHLPGLRDRPAGPAARQVAVLILRDVLGFRASEVAGLLDSTLESVTSALKRARASLQRQQPPACREPPPACGSPAEDALVAKLVRAWESPAMGALVALLTDDVFMAMPPVPFAY